MTTMLTPERLAFRSANPKLGMAFNQSDSTDTLCERASADVSRAGHMVISQFGECVVEADKSQSIRTAMDRLDTACYEVDGRP